MHHYGILEGAKNLHKAHLDFNTWERRSKFISSSLPSLFLFFMVIQYWGWIV